MFSELQPYARYQTGVPVLGSVPESWHIQPLRSLIVQRTERNRIDLPLLSVARRRGVFVRSSLDDNHNAIPEDLSNYKVAREGDLVINKMKGWQGSLGSAPCDGIVSPAYYVYDFRMRNRLYGEVLLRSRPYVELFAAASDGVRIGQWDLVVSRMRGIPVLLPSSSEQEAIVKYLAHAHRRIARAIDAKRRLIALLEERKQAVINQAVTRGLDSRESTAWPQVMLGRLLQRLEQGWSPRAAEGAIEPDQWSVLTLSAINGGRFRPEAIKPIEKDAEVPHELRVLDGDLLMTRSNTRLRVGDVAIASGVNGMTIFSDLIYRLTLRREVADTSYVAAVLRSRWGRLQIERAARGSSETMPKLSQAHIRSIMVPLPSIEEQRSIVERLTAESVASDVAIDHARREIALLQEFRTRLTADVVTGQVDVREIAAGLPDIDPAELEADVTGVSQDDLSAYATDGLEDVLV